MGQEGDNELQSSAGMMMQVSAQVYGGKIQGLEHWTRDQIKSAVRRYIEDIVAANRLDFRIADMGIVGSRTRGTATLDSDLDVVVQYTGGLKEDRAQDIFNIEKLRLNNIEVDILPIREPLKRWLERTKGYVKIHYDDVPYPEVVEEIEKVPDINEPRRLSYWTRKGDKIIYIEGWCDKCLLGTGFPPIERGGTFEKLMYLEDLTPKILEAKAKERGLKILRGGFVETPDKTYLYGVTWGVFREPPHHMVKEPVKVQIPLGAEPWQITQEIINKLVRQGGRLVDDYGFEWILPGPRERERYYLTFTLETEYRGETIRVHARKVAGWQQLLEKLRSARTKAGRYGISEPALRQITFGGEAVKVPLAMEKLLIEFLEKDPFPPTSYVLLAKIRRGEEPSQYEWLRLEHALLLKKYDIPKWIKLWEHYNSLGKFKVEFRGTVRENVMQMPFSTTRTGMPFYDMMLENPIYFRKNKGLTGKIVYVSPDEYIAKAVECMGTTTIPRFVQLIDEELIKRYADSMLKGVKFDMPVIECERGYQEGRHRVLAAKKIGVTQIPVYMVEKVKENQLIVKEPTDQSHPYREKQR